MTPRLTQLTPARILGAGALAAAGVAICLRDTTWLAAPILLAVTILIADAAAAALRGRPPRLSGMSWFLAGVCLAATALVRLRDPALVVTLLPILAVTGVPVVLPRRDRARIC